ncbi:beta-ketoacyl-ACP synthase II [bacterium]|nr:beta-ketoacyl-ACP synthase II [bacterium]
MKNRVVVTGIGIIAPTGIGKEKFWEGIKAGNNYAGPITHFDATNHPSKVAAEIKDFDATKYIPLKNIRKMDRSTHLGIATAIEALNDSGLAIEENNRHKVGVIVGTGAGGMGFAEKEMGNFFENGLKKVNPYAAVSVFCGAISGEIGIRLNARGLNISVSNGCTSANDALGYAFNCVRSGVLDAVITGGSDACVTPAIVGSFCRINALSTKRNDEPQKASRPFNKDRDGFVMSEGSWTFIFENHEKALNRGAKIYAEVVGYGATCDAFHMTAPAPDAKETARAIRMAIDDAGISPDKIDYIVAHGTSTPLNDLHETLSIKEAFGDHAFKVPISSIKSMIGHAIGAAAAANFSTAVYSTINDFIPPTINFDSPDPECDLDYTPNVGKKKHIQYALCNAIGFGSKNASLIVKKYVK